MCARVTEGDSSFDSILVFSVAAGAAPLVFSPKINSSVWSNASPQHKTKRSLSHGHSPTLDYQLLLLNTAVKCTICLFFCKSCQDILPYNHFQNLLNKRSISIIYYDEHKIKSCQKGLFLNLRSEWTFKSIDHMSPVITSC